MTHQSLPTQILQVLQIQLYVLYLLFHAAQEFLRNLHFKHYGTKKERGKIWVSRIILKKKLDPEEISKRQDFVTAGGEWMDLETMDNPCWNLYCVEKNRAFFVLLPRPITYYSLGRFPFMFVPVHEEALALAEVSKDEFLQLSKTFSERPQPKTVLFTNTARCGSTLMGKMLDRPGKTVCFGEPHSLCNLAIALGEETMTEDEVSTLLKATVTCLRAHVPSDHICVLKTTSGEARLVPLMKEIPHLKHMFMFRKKGLPSVEKVVRREEFMANIMLSLYNFSPLICRYISYLYSMEGPFVRKLKPDNMRLYSAIIYASPYSDYLANKDLYAHPVVWYHELLENTSKTLAQLFTAIDIPIECVEAAVACKKEDSQKNSFLSWDHLKHVQIPPVTDEDRVALSQYAEAMKVPTDTFDC